MKTKIITLTQLTQDESNKQGCWSAKRVMKECPKCDKYPICKSKIVNSKYDELVNKRKYIYGKAGKVTEQIKKFE